MKTPAMQLNAKQQAELKQAILDAYPGFVGLGQLVQALAYMNIDLARYGNPLAMLDYSLFSAIQDLNARGRIADIVGAARRGNPADPTLARLEEEWIATTGAEKGTSRLEAMVVSRLNFQPGAGWLTKLKAAFGWVCRVERQADGQPLGTGFLIADNMVLTNYHVLFSRHSNTQHAVQFRFDALAEQPGKVVGVDQTKPMYKSPPGGSEWNASGDPSDSELDFAVLHLNESIGAAQTDTGERRGHAQFDTDAESLATQRPLVILEHPNGAPLQICLGSIVGTNDLKTRVYHTATTQSGASGSPCLSMELNVIALHNGGIATKHNTAVPIRSIASSLPKA